MIKITVCTLVFVFAVGAAFTAVKTRAGITNAQKATLSKETQLKLLKLEEARVSLQTAEDLFADKKANLSDLQELYKKDVVTGKEVTDSETELKNATRNLELAKIDLAKTALSFLQDVTHISILTAYQYIDPDNNRHMSVTLKNDSDMELATLGIGEGVPEAGIEQKKLAGLLTIENLFVSIKSGSTIIGDPFEIKVSKLPLNRTATLDFKLNSPAEDISLSMKYHNTEDVRNVYLEKKSTEDVVRVSSLQFAQEGELGSTVEFGVDLERLAENEKTFTLGVIGLPSKYTYKFVDKGIQLSQVKFSQGATKQSLTLQVSVPDKLPDAELRKPIRFYAVVGEDVVVQNLSEQSNVSPEALKALKVGYEKLELTPRGTGKFDISFPTLYYEIKTGDKIEAKMTLNNTGSVRLDDITFNIEKPYDWDVKLNPDNIDSIEPRKEVEIKVTITPPEKVEVGAFEIKFEGTTDHEGTTIKTDKKNMRIQVSAKTNLTMSLLIVGGLILFIVVIAIVTVKISRR